MEIVLLYFLFWLRAARSISEVSWSYVNAGKSYAQHFYFHICPLETVRVSGFPVIFCAHFTRECCRTTSRSFQQSNCSSSDLQMVLLNQLLFVLLYFCELLTTFSVPNRKILVSILFQKAAEVVLKTCCSISRFVKYEPLRGCHSTSFLRYHFSYNEGTKNREFAPNLWKIFRL